MSTWRERLRTATDGRGVFVRRVATIDRNTRLVLLLALAFFLWFTVYLSLLYQRNLLHGTDFGRYVHMFATTVHGTGFLDSGVYRVYLPKDTYWGRHFTLTLLLYLPLYALVPSPYTLIVVKSLVVAASIPMLWLLARTRLDDRYAGLCVVAYALNPFLWSAWAFEFQEQIIVPVLVFATHYLYVRERHGWFLVALTLALVTNEYMVLFVGGYLFALAISAYRTNDLAHRRVPLAAGFVLTALTKVVASAVMDAMSIRTGIARLRLAGPILAHVDGPTTSVGELATALLSNPTLVPELLVIDAPTKLVYFLALLAPVFFVALRDEVPLLALAPWLGFAWLIDGTGATYMFRAHYPFYVLPFVYVGAVRVVGRYSDRIPRLSRTGFVVFAALLVVTSAGVWTVIDGGNAQSVAPESDHNDSLEAAIDQIPADASLVTQNTVYPKVATRPHATFVTADKNFRRYEGEYGPVTPEYVLYSDQLAQHGDVTGAFGDRLGTEYGLYLQGDGVYVWKRGYEGEPNPIHPDDGQNAQSDATQASAPVADAPHHRPSFAASSVSVTGSAPERVHRMLL